MNIRIGQKLKPIPQWNKTEKHRKLPDLAEVLDIRKKSSQTGVMVLVNQINGDSVWLDLGWFKEFENAKKGDIEVVI